MTDKYKSRTWQVLNFFDCCGCLILCVVLAALAYSDSPQAEAHQPPEAIEPVELPSVLVETPAAVGVILVAPETCEVGELVYFDATSSDVDSLVFDIVPPTPDFKVEGDGAFFSARKKGEWRVIVAGAKGGQAFLTHATIKVGNKPVGPWKDITERMEKKQ